MSYDFDRLISRCGTNALAEDGFENYLFGANAPMPALDVPREELISMWVADMQFAAPDAAIDAISERLKHPVFGYTMNFDDQLYQAFHAWCVERYGWRFAREDMLVALGVIPALFGLVVYFTYARQRSLLN